MLQSDELHQFRAEALPDIGRDDDVPVGVQLAWRLRALILSGRLEAGERLHGVREMAAGAGVNVNTVRAVYRRLEDEGLVVSRHGLGTFVADDLEASPALDQLAAEAAEAARANGIAPRDLARTLYAGSDPAIHDRGTRASTSGDRIEDPRSLRRRPKATDVPPAARSAPRSPASRPSSPPTPRTSVSRRAQPPVSEPTAHVADIGELEETRDELIDRLREARDAAQASARREQAARSRLEEMIEDPAAHKWATISNEELGETGCTTYEVQPAWGPVGALMNWWRIRVSGGCPLAAPLEAAREKGQDRRWSEPRSTGHSYPPSRSSSRSAT